MSLTNDSRQHILDELIHPYAEPPAKSTMEVFDEISLDWKTQIYNHVVRKFGGKPSSYLQGVTKDTALPQMAVEEFAEVVIRENDNDPRLAADVLKASITEHVTLMTATAMNQAMKEKGLMGAVTKVTDKMIETVNEKGQDLAELSELIEAAQVNKGAVKHADTAPRKTVKRKAKKKGAKRQTHLDNIKGHGIKQAMGANILRKLGAIQQKTLDHTKHQLLQELPLADLVEVASGEKLPDYQANLLNSMQAKADPNAPVVKRQAETKEEVLTQLQEECVAVQKDVEKLENGVLRVTIDPDDPDPAGTVDVIFKEYTKATGIEITKGDLTVSTIGGSIKDIRLAYKDRSSILHYERFTEQAADQLQSTINFVTERIADPAYYSGLVQSIIEHGEPKFAEWVDTIDFEQAVGLVEKLVVGYTVGYVQGIVDSLHKQTLLAQAAPAADLGI